MRTERRTRIATKRTTFSKKNVHGRISLGNSHSEKQDFTTVNVRADNTALASYKERQGGFGSVKTHACKTCASI